MESKEGEQERARGLRVQEFDREWTKGNSRNYGCFQGDQMRRDMALAFAAAEVALALLRRDMSGVLDAAAEVCSPISTLTMENRLHKLAEEVEEWKR
jgi:hypothetical protein